jgi:serine/threonine protein phosphatase PrpC
VINFLRRFLGGETTLVEENTTTPAEPSPLPATAQDAETAVVFGRGLLAGKDSHIGLVRERNEDAFFSLESTLQQDGELLHFGLFIVADGMGGHQRGEVASSLATRIVASHVLRDVYLSVLEGGEQSSSRPPINEVLIEAVVKANAYVHQEAPEAGTTMTTALILGQRAYIAHVGDSRAYLFNHGTLKQITQDHSLLARLIELGQASEEEALTHPQRNVLYRAVGQAGNLEVDIYPQSLPIGSYLLLCSDGLWGMVPAQEMIEIIGESIHPQQACHRLIEAANKHGGEDNVTAILVRIGE